MKFKVIKPITLHAGMLALTDKQASVRMHALKPAEKGVYEVTGAVQFKLGEILNFTAEPDKAVLAHLEEMRAEKKAAPPAA